MKIAIRIFLIFSLLFVVAGAGCMGAGFILGGSFEEVSNIGGEIPLNFWRSEAVRRIAGFPLVRRASKKSTKEVDQVTGNSTGFAEVENLYINVSAGEVQILEGDGEEILVETASRGAEAKLEDGTLTVQGGWEGLFSDEAVTKVKIPRDYVFKKVTLVGTGEINCGSLTADTVVIDANAADITIDGRLWAREKLEVKANAADVTIEKAAWAPTVELESNAGDIDVVFEGSRSDYNISTEVNLGDITVEDADADDGSGRNPAGQVRAKCNVGDIDIDFEE